MKEKLKKIVKTPFPKEKKEKPHTHTHTCKLCAHDFSHKRAFIELGRIYDTPDLNLSCSSGKG